MHLQESRCLRHRSFSPPDGLVSCCRHCLWLIRRTPFELRRQPFAKCRSASPLAFALGLPAPRPVARPTRRREARQRASRCRAFAHLLVMNRERNPQAARAWPGFAQFSRGKDPSTALLCPPHWRSVRLTRRCVMRSPGDVTVGTPVPVRVGRCAAHGARRYLALPAPVAYRQRDACWFRRDRFCFASLSLFQKPAINSRLSVQAGLGQTTAAVAYRR